MPDPNQNSNNIGNAYGPPQSPQSPTQGQFGANQYNSGLPFVNPQSGNAFSPTQVGNDGNANDQTGGKMSTQEGQTYGGLFNQAGGMSNYFNGLANNYNQNSPQISDVSQLQGMTNYYQNALAGNGPSVAQNQFRQAQDQSIAAQMAMANSARGGAAAQAGAMRAATQGAGAQMASAANQSAQLRAQEQQAAAQGLTGIGQLELQRGSQNASLQQNNQQQINQMQTALWGMGEQEQGLSLSAQQAYMQNLLAAEGINTQQSQFNTNLGVQLGAAGVQAVGSGIGAAVSDANLKTDIAPQGSGGIGSIDYSKPVATTPGLQGPPSNATSVGIGAGVGGGVGAAEGAITGGPVGAAIGGAGGALQGGLGAASQSRPKDDGLKAANTAASTGIGAAGGAAAGSAFGPWGTAIGAGVGAIGGLIKGLMT